MWPLTKSYKLFPRTVAATAVKLATNTKHNCSKNHTGSVESMESKGIVEAFESAPEKYGCYYLEYVGDGDTTVADSIICNVSKPFSHASYNIPYITQSQESSDGLVLCYSWKYRNIHKNIYIYIWTKLKLKIINCQICEQWKVRMVKEKSYHLCSIYFLLFTGFIRYQCEEDTMRQPYDKKCT